MSGEDPAEDPLTSGPTRVDTGIPTLSLEDEPATPLPALEPDERVAGRYRVHGLLGRGGFGEVYRVFDERSADAPLALKLHRVAGQNPVALEAIKAEFAILRTLVHPNLAPVYDFGYVGEAVAYFTQALVPGARLDRIDLDLATPRAVRLVAQLCRALDYLHARGILHRDVKPSNVLVETTSEHLVLLDFGISRALGHEERGLLMGTHAFMAPEAFRGGPVDARSDLYSLGVTLYKIAAGNLPFPATGAASVSGHLYETPPSLLDRGVHPGVATVIERLLAKEPGDRYASAGEVAEALGDLTGVVLPRETQETMTSYVLSGGFVGFEDVLGALTSAALDTSAGREPVTLVGEAGTGKSRLLREVQHRVQLAGRSWIGVEVLRTEAGRGLVRDVAEAVVTDEVAHALAEDDRIELARGLPSLRRRGERIAIPLDPDRARDLRLLALGRAMAKRFLTRPGVLAVEDLHWALPDVRQMVVQLVEAARAAGARVLVVLTARPNDDVLETLDRIGGDRFSTERLGPEQSRALVGSMFGDSTILDGTGLARELAAGPHSALWVQESLRLLVERGSLVRKAGRWEVVGAVEASPLQEVLSQRLARLSSNASQLALAAATLAEPAGANELSAVAGRKVSSAAPALRELVRAGIVEDRRDARGRTVYVMHDRYVDAASDFFNDRRRRAAHAKASKHLRRRAHDDPQRLGRAGRHARAAGQLDDAATLFREAAERADRIGRPDVALHWLDEALSMSSRREIGALLQRHDLALRAGRPGQASATLADLSRARRRATPEQKVELVICEAREAMRSGDGPRARRRIRTALKRARASSLREHEVAAHLLAGEMEWTFGAIGASLDAYLAGAQAAASIGDRASEGRGYLGASLAALHLGDNRRARGTAEAAERALKGSSDASLRSNALRQLGNVLREQGDSARASRAYGRAVRAARATGDLDAEAKALNNLGTTAQWMGRVGDALSAFERSIALKERLGAAVSRLITLNNVGALYTAIGEHQRAREALDEVVETEGDNPSVVSMIARSNLADLAVVTGDLERAQIEYLRAYQECLARDFATQLNHAVTGLLRVRLMLDGPGGGVDELLAILDRQRTELDMAEAERRFHVCRAMRFDAIGQHAEALSAARLAVRAIDRQTALSDVFGTELESRFIEAIVLARLGRTKASARAVESCRQTLSQLAIRVGGATAQRVFLFGSPLNRSIERRAIDTPPGWSWARES